MRGKIVLAVAFATMMQAFSAGCSQTVTENICDKSIQWFDSADARIDAMIPHAELAATNLLSGGKFYVCGNPGFCDEFVFRAGGVSGTEEWKGQNLKGNDVILYAEFRPNDAVNGMSRLLWKASDGRSLRWPGPQIIMFAGKDWPTVQNGYRQLAGSAFAGGHKFTIIDTAAPYPDSLANISVSQMAATATAWAFVGEIFAAVSRQGKTLATYASDYEPNGHDWDKHVGDKIVLPEYRIPSIPPGNISRQYFQISRRQIEEFRRTQPDKLRNAARFLAQKMNDGKTAWIVSSSHVHGRGGYIPPQLDRIIDGERDYVWNGKWREISSSDVAVIMGYLYYDDDLIDALVKRGIPVVSITCKLGPDSPQVMQVASCWDEFDTVIPIENYPVKILPTSGVVQTPQWYSLMGEIIPLYDRTQADKNARVAKADHADDAAWAKSEILRKQAEAALRGEDIASGVELFSKAVDAYDKNNAARLQLAWLLASTYEDKYRDPSRAIALVEEARRSAGDSGWRQRELDEISAVAYAAAGRYDDAAALQGRLVDEARRHENWDAAKWLNGRLELFRSHKPYVTSRPAPKTQPAESSPASEPAPRR